MTSARGLWIAVASLALALPALGQRPRPLPDGDPYRGAEGMGYRATGAMWWTPDISTTAVEHALGTSLLWVQTEHFRIGSNLTWRPLPRDDDGRRILREDLAALNRQLPTIDAETDQLDPWLTVHWLAFCLERQYAEFAAMAGAAPHTVELDPAAAAARADAAQESTDAPQGAAAEVLGRPQQFAVLLLESPSDLGRFHLAFEGAAGEGVVHGVSGGALTLATSPVQPGNVVLDAKQLKGHVVHHTAALLLRGCWRLTPEVPLWLEWGLGARFARAHADYGECPPRDVDFAALLPERPWGERIAGRARHRTAPGSAEMYTWLVPDDLDLARALRCWSKVDFLLAKGPEGLRRMLLQLKRDEPPCRAGSATRAAFWSDRAVRRAWGHDPEALDEAWRLWAVRAYVDR